MDFSTSMAVTAAGMRVQSERMKVISEGQVEFAEFPIGDMSIFKIGNSEFQIKFFNC